MSSQPIVIKALSREQTSKGALYRARKTGVIPGVIYSKAGGFSITIPRANLPKEHTRAALVTIDVDGKSRLALMREVQINPLNDAPIHIDFQEVSLDQMVSVRIPLQFTGLTRDQEKEGSFKTLLRSVEVRAPAGKLPLALDVPVGHLKIDESAHLKDIQLPEGVILRAKRNLALASLVRM